MKRRITAQDEQGEVTSNEEDAFEQRRRFLELCKTFAVGMPPAMTLLAHNGAYVDHEDPPFSPCPYDDDDECEAS